MLNAKDQKTFIDVPVYRSSQVVEIEFNGKHRFDYILADISAMLGIQYRILSADLEFCGEKNIGQMRLQMETSKNELTELTSYLESKRLLSSVVELQ